MGHETNFVPNPVQRSFIESRAKADLFSSRMGEGKSTSIAWSALYHTRHNPGANWAIIRDTWENLQATTMKSFFAWFPPGVYGTYHATKKEFTWASGVAQGSVVFLGMDAPQDATKLMSRELAGIAIDEPAPAISSLGVDELIFDIGLSRLRQPGMNWYGAKLAENNPDENHWTYRRFVEDDQALSGFRVHQPLAPENIANLPSNYYAELRQLWRHRPDLVRRFVEGEFGFQAIGKAVTPQWNDKLHLSQGLIPIKGRELILLWDFGHNATCIITQITPMGNWNILDAIVGQDEGVQEVVENQVAPLLKAKYNGFSYRHIGDPAGEQGDQSSKYRSPVLYIKKYLGGPWRAGPVRWLPRIEPLRAVLTRTVGGKGLVQVDRVNAKAIWQALRGGWHFHVSPSGIISSEAEKTIESHPGDALSYGAAILYPLQKGALGQGTGNSGLFKQQEASYFGSGKKEFIGRPGLVLPRHGSKL